MLNTHRVAALKARWAANRARCAVGCFLLLCAWMVNSSSNSAALGGTGPDASTAPTYNARSGDLAAAAAAAAGDTRAASPQPTPQPTATVYVIPDPKPLQGSRMAILAMATGYSVAKIESFVVSARRAMPHAAIHLLVDAGSVATMDKYFKASSATFWDADKICNAFAPCASSRWGNEKRIFLELSWLADHRSKYDLIALSDSRDVIFQAPIMPDFKMWDQHTLYVAAERKWLALDKCPKEESARDKEQLCRAGFINANWYTLVRLAWAEDCAVIGQRFQKVADQQLDQEIDARFRKGGAKQDAAYGRRVVNSGVIIGSPSTLGLHLNLTQRILEKLQTCKYKTVMRTMGVDQGVCQYIAYAFTTRSRGYHVHIFGWDQGPVRHFSDGQSTYCNASALTDGLRNDAGREVPIVHQYDRCKPSGAVSLALYRRYAQRAQGAAGR